VAEKGRARRERKTHILHTQTQMECKKMNGGVHTEIVI